MSNGKNHELLAGSWIVDAGPGQFKTLATYTPLGGGLFNGLESAINFDWTLGGAKPTATHGTSVQGIVDASGKEIEFVLITYALDASGKAVYISKAVGNKIFLDKDTIHVVNLVMHIYNNPDTANPVTDTADFTVPPSGTFPPILEYRIK